MDQQRSWLDAKIGIGPDMADEFLDVARLLRGELEPATLRQLYAFPVGLGEAVPIDDSDLVAVLTLPSDRWVEADARLAELGAKGVVLLEHAVGALAEARRRDE